MKNLLVILSAISTIILGNTVFAQVNPEGIISCWKFNEGSGIIAYDSVGTNDGIIYGGPTWTTGKVNGALEFDGIDDNVIVPLDTSLKPANEISVIAWVNTPGGEAKGIIDTFRWAYKRGFLLETGNDPISAFGDVYFTVGDGSAVAFAHSFGPINDGQWYHLVGTFNGQSVKLYIDGILVATSTTPYWGGHFPQIIQYPNVDLEIGGRMGLDVFKFEGTIDEVAIYNRALSDSEVWQLYQNGLNGLGCGETAQATIDIDPDTLNLASKGKPVTCYIELEEGFDVIDIDVNTILLNGTVNAELEPIEIGDYDDDGIPDLMVKFDRFSVQEILGVGDEVEIVITGEVAGEHFVGSDTIRVIDKGRR